MNNNILDDSKNFLPVFNAGDLEQIKRFEELYGKRIYNTQYIVAAIINDHSHIIDYFFKHKIYGKNMNSNIISLSDHAISSNSHQTIDLFLEQDIFNKVPFNILAFQLKWVIAQAKYETFKKIIDHPNTHINLKTGNYQLLKFIIMHEATPLFIYYRDFLINNIQANGHLDKKFKKWLNQNKNFNDFFYSASEKIELYEKLNIDDVTQKKNNTIKNKI